MTDTSGPTSLTPLAYYDPDTSSLRTSQGTFPLASTECSLTLPRSGSMRSGALYERPTLEPATDELGCSSLLLSPSAGDGEGGGRKNPPPRGVGTKQGSGGLREQVRTLLPNLPTPTAWLGRREAHSKGDPARWTNPERSNELSDFVAWLLPTPSAGNPNDGEDLEKRHGNGNCLPGAITALPSPGTNDSSDDQHPTQPMLGDD